MLNDEARAKILKRKTLLYEMLLRNQKHLPHIDSAMCTYEFLKEVYENSTFAFEMHEVRVRNVVTCPSLAQLQTMSVRALEGILHHKINCIPTSEFKITVLLTHVGSR